MKPLSENVSSTTDCIRIRYSKKGASEVLMQNVSFPGYLSARLDIEVNEDDLSKTLQQMSLNSPEDDEWVTVQSIDLKEV